MADSGTLGILLERECPTVHNLIMATEAKVIAATEVLADAEVPLGAPMLLSELDLSPYSISEIEALAQRIPGVIAIKRAEARQRILRKIENLAEQEGFSLEELLEKP